MQTLFRRGLLALCCAALPLTLAAAPSNPVASGTTTDKRAIRIGVIGPFTGPSSDFGVPMLNGIRLAIDEINAFGGYLGTPLELVVKDDKASPELGQLLSNVLIKEDKVVAAIGFCNTGVALSSIASFQNTKTPLIVPCATGTPITARFPPAESYIFRTSAKDGIQVPFVVDDIVARRWTRVAVFADTSGYGEAGVKEVEEALARKRIKPVYVARFPLGVQDLRAQLREARAARANVIFSITVGPENAAIARGRRALAWKVPQVGPWTLSFPYYIEAGNDVTDGTLMAQTFIAEPTNERRATFLRAYSKKYPGQALAVPMAAAQGYDSTYLLAQALLSIPVGKLDGTAIKTALESPKRTHYGVVTTYDNAFTPNDKDAITQNMLMMGIMRNGRVTFAYPADAKRALFVQRKRQVD